MERVATYKSNGPNKVVATIIYDHRSNKFAVNVYCSGIREDSVIIVTRSPEEAHKMAQDICDRDEKIITTSHAWRNS